MTAAVVTAVVAMVGVLGGLVMAWRSRVALAAARDAQDAAQGARKAAGAARRQLDAAISGRMPLQAWLEVQGLPQRRAEQMAREIAARVEQETGQAVRVRGGSASRLEGHPVGSSAAFRPAGR